MKLVIDSSVFVAAFREKEPHSREAFRLLLRIESGMHSAIMPVTVILEVMAAIRRRTGNDALAKSVGGKLLSLPSISLIDMTAFRMAQYLDIVSGSGLSGMDSIVVGVAREFGAPLVSLDKEIINRGRAWARTVDIQEV